MRTILAASLALAILGSAADAAETVYHEDFGAQTPPERMMGGGLLLGDDGVWTGSVEDASYVLENAVDANAVRYYFVAAREYDLSRASVAVTVETQGRGEAYGGGILYDYEPVSRSYWAFTVRDGAYLVLRRRPEGMQKVASGSIAGVDGAARARLVLIAKGDKLHFFAGRERLVSIGYPRAAGESAGRGVGIIAFGLGRFRFDDFAVAVE